MNPFKMLFAAAALALTTSAAGAAVVQPVMPPYQLSVMVFDGPLNGLSTIGSVSWNTGALTGMGYETLTGADVALSFDAGGLYTFTQADDDRGAFFNFLDGVLQTIDYIVMDAFSPADLAAYGVELFTFDTRRPLGFDGSTVYVNVIVKYPAPVPLPAGLPLLGGALGLMALMHRRRLDPQAVPVLRG